MANIDELAAKAAEKAAKRAEKNKTRPMDAPVKVQKRPWHRPPLDESSADQNALKSVLSNVEPSPSSVKAPAIRIEGSGLSGQNFAEELPNTRKDEQIITNQLVTNRSPISNQSPIEYESVTNASAIDNKSNSDRIVIDQEPITNPSATDHQSNTNRSQMHQQSIRNPSVTDLKSVTNQLPSDHKSIRNKSQMHLKSITNKSVTELPTESLTARDYLQQIPKGVRLVDYMGIAQAQIIGVIYNSCVANKSNVTSPLTVSLFMKATGIGAPSVANRIRLLKQRGLLIQGKVRTGPGGWATYELPEIIYQTLADEGVEITNHLLTSHSPNYSPNYPDLASRKNRIEIKSNLSDLGPEAEEPEFSFEYGDWDSLNLDPVQGYQFRLDKLRSDVTNQKLTVDVATLQDMVERFPIYVMGLPTAPSKPYGLFMSLVQKRSKGNDVMVGTPTCYEVWAAEATKRRIAEQNTAFNQAFMEWEATMPDSERIEMVKSESENPFMDFNDTKDPRFRELLLASFRNKIWNKKP